jgi:hypothetical protein
MELTATTTVAELASLQDHRVRFTTPHGRTAEGVVSYATHRDRGGIRVHWAGSDEWTVVPYGTTANILATEGANR